MKRYFLTFFIIALLAELGTTWFQRLHTVTDVAPGLYYPDFRTLMLDRLVVWVISFAVLSGISLLILRLIHHNKS